MSAFRIKVTPSWASPGKTLIPMLAEQLTLPAATAYGRDSSVMIFCATIAASSAARSASRTTTNSSPPIRASVSPLRIKLCRRSATVRNNSSPAACPRESLMVLNRSRSMNRTATRPWLRCADMSPCERRSVSSRRFGNCVSASRVASSSMRCSASLRSVISSAVPRRPISTPAVSKIGTPDTFCQICRPSFVITMCSRFRNGAAAFFSDM